MEYHLHGIPTATMRCRSPQIVDYAMQISPNSILLNSYLPNIVRCEFNFKRNCELIVKTVVLIPRI